MKTLAAISATLGAIALAAYMGAISVWFDPCGAGAIAHGLGGYYIEFDANCAAQ